jgi:hypothetical protein
VILRGREVVGLEVSGCCVVSTCCSKARENVVSEGVAFSDCDLVESLLCWQFMQEQRPCLFGDIGETDCGGTVSEDNTELLSCKNGCQGEKAVTGTFNKINIS